MLARPDVGDVRAAPGHVVAEPVEHVQRGVEARRRPPLAGDEDRVAAPDVGVIDADEVQGDTVAGSLLLDPLAVGLHAADPHRARRGEHVEALIGVQPPARERARHDGAAAAWRRRCGPPTDAAARDRRRPGSWLRAGSSAPMSSS